MTEQERSEYMRPQHIICALDLIINHCSNEIQEIERTEGNESHEAKRKLEQILRVRKTYEDIRTEEEEKVRKAREQFDSRQRNSQQNEKRITDRFETIQKAIEAFKLDKGEAECLNCSFNDTPKYGNPALVLLKALLSPDEYERLKQRVSQLPRDEFETQIYGCETLVHFYDALKSVLSLS